MNWHQARPLAVAAAVLAAVSGCTNFSTTQGRNEVRSLVAAHSPDLEETSATTPQTQGEIAARVAAILAAPLSVQGAVSVALLRNPRVQIEYARLDIAAADVVEAGRLRNPTLSLSWLVPLGGPDAALGNGAFTQSFADLVLLRVRERAAAGEYRRAQAVAASAIVELVADVEAAWYRYLGATQVSALRTRMAAAAQASADLAAQYRAAGNLSLLQLSEERAAATQARLAALRARSEGRRARDELNALLGLTLAEDHWSTEEQLAVPEGSDDHVEALLDLAHAQRLDLLAARAQLALHEQALAATQRHRWLGTGEFGVAGERDTDRSRLVGPTLTVQLPIFNQGQGTLARAAALLEEQRARLRALELDVDASVRIAAERVSAARETAEEYRAALIPERSEIVAQTQAGANYMLVGTFELLLARQAQYDADQGYVEAVRDYWLARVDLTRAVGTRLPSRPTNPGEAR
jgi:cobalt-zinc-cadmium efflux system outer membrane protein